MKAPSVKFAHNTVRVKRHSENRNMMSRQYVIRNEVSKAVRSLFKLGCNTYRGAVSEAVLQNKKYKSTPWFL